MNNAMSSRHRCKGFTLLEALIGFLILSIGMLGIASLQAISLKAGKTSVYGSVAMMKVDELIESIRANPSAAALAEYTGAGASNGCTGVIECSDIELAQDDVFRWKQDITVGLPSTATTAIVYTPAVAPSKLATMNITVNWDERDKGSSGSVSKSYTTTINICTVVPC
jgi:type IV pilus assembly protein PilV